VVLQIASDHQAHQNILHALRGDLDDIRTTADDVHYLIDGTNHIFPEVNLSMKDVESSWVGLRPLIQEEGKSASELSRKDEIFESETGLLSIAGGKLTGYRKMAERIVNKIARKKEEKGEPIGECRTDQITLTGGVFANVADVDTYVKEISKRLEPEGLAHMAVYLVHNYGRQTDMILDLFEDMEIKDPEEALGMAELEFTLKNESVFSALDFFERRTGRLYFNIESVRNLKEPVLKHLKSKFKWSAQRIKQEKIWLDQAIDRCSSFE
jgi:glycerol-3-phosphate dehydrogenase